MISSDSTVNTLPVGAAPHASTDESPFVPVVKMSYFFLPHSLPLRPANQEGDGGVGGYYKATNQDVIMQFSMCTMIKGAIIEARDF